MVNSRAKGRRGELEVAKLLSVALETECKLNYAQSAHSGYDLALFGWAVEVKRAEKPEWNAWFAQALGNAQRDRLMPVLFHRANHARGWDVYMPVAVFLVVWGGAGPFNEHDWLRVSFDVAVATMKRVSEAQKNPGDKPGLNTHMTQKETT